MEPDTSWASLPWDLLMEMILRRLDSAAVLRCAGTCRPWRRAIIANSSCFDAVDLIGFFDAFRYVYHPLQPQSASASVLTAADVTWARYPQPYMYPLSSRNGIVLLGGVVAADGLCLCNPLAGICTFLPAAAPDMSPSKHVMASYILVTGRDAAATDSAVWVLAVKKGVHQENVSSGMTYQIFSSASGVWGPVKRSARLEEGGLGTAYMFSGPEDVAVCRGGAVYWLGMSTDEGGRLGWRRRAFGMDVRTERTWTTRFPEKYALLGGGSTPTCFMAMATSEDSRRLSLIVPLPRHRMEVWVLTGGDGGGDGEWTLRRTMDLHNPHCFGQGYVSLRSFCPRSRCLVGVVAGNLYLIPVDEASPRPMTPIQWVDKGRVSCQ